VLATLQADAFPDARIMIDALSLVKYALVAVGVFLPGAAAGAFVKHPQGSSSYAVPIALAICGVVAAVASWNLHKRPGGPRSSFGSPAVKGVSTPGRELDKPDA
jgi:hypothetical protein